MYTWEHLPYTTVLRVPSKMPTLAVLSTQKSADKTADKTGRCMVTWSATRTANAGSCTDTFQTIRYSLDSVAF